MWWRKIDFSLIGTKGRAATGICFHRLTGLGHHPLKVKTGVRTPLEVPSKVLLNRAESIELSAIDAELIHCISS